MKQWLDRGNVYPRWQYLSILLCAGMVYAAHSIYWIWHGRQVMQHICLADGLGQADLAFFNHKGRMQRSAIKKSGQHIHSHIAHTKKHNLVFIHIPKNGGTSIQDLARHKIAKGVLRHYDTKKSCYTFVHRDHITPQQAVDLQVEKKDTYGKNVVFAVVRNPYTRVVSAYNNLKELAIISGQTTLDEFIDITERVLQATNREKDFIPFIFTQFTQLQADYIYFQDGTPAVKEVLRFESLSEDWENLVKKYPEFDLEKKLPHKNRSGQGSEVRLTESQKERVYRMYKTDFEKFGYRE